MNNIGKILILEINDFDDINYQFPNEPIPISTNVLSFLEDLSETKEQRISLKGFYNSLDPSKLNQLLATKIRKIKRSEHDDINHRRNSNEARRVSNHHDEYEPKRKRIIF